VLNILSAKIEAVSGIEGGANVLVRLNLNGAILLSSITQKSTRELDLRPGQSVYAQIKATTLSK
jgi:molybdate transport system ATP-binding protein